MSDNPQLDRPRIYQIRVEGVIDSLWSDWFGGFTIVPQANGDTLLVGAVSDQAALHGLLNKIRDIGLPLLSLQQVRTEETSEINQMNRRKKHDTTD